MSEHILTTSILFIKTPKQLLAVVVLSFVIPVVRSRSSPASRRAASTPSDSEVRRSDRQTPEACRPGRRRGRQRVPGQKTGKQIVDRCARVSCDRRAQRAEDRRHRRVGAAHQGGLRPSHPERDQRHTPDAAARRQSQLTDAEVARAVAFMANQSGAKFTEPPVQPARRRSQPPQRRPAAPGGCRAAPAPRARQQPAGGSANGKASTRRAASHATARASRAPRSSATKPRGRRA